jgi:hypothetical protein
VVSLIKPKFPSHNSIGNPRRFWVVPWINERRVAWSFPPLFLSGDPLSGNKEDSSAIL